MALAEEYRKAERYDEALATLTRGLDAHPSYLSAQIAIARLYQETGKIPEALLAFQKVLAADRQNLVAAKSLADLYRAQGETLEALKKYKLYRALSADPEAEEVIAELERKLLAAPGGFVAPPPALSAQPVESFPPPEPAAAPASEEPFFLEDSSREEAPAPELSAPADVRAKLAAPTAAAPESEAVTGKIPASRTLADLYYDQGYFEDARRIYERLAQAHPNDEGLAQRLKQLSAERTERMETRNGPGSGSLREMRVAALRSWLVRVQERSAKA